MAKSRRRTHPTRSSLAAEAEEDEGTMSSPESGADLGRWSITGRRRRFFFAAAATPCDRRPWKRGTGLHG